MEFVVRNNMLLTRDGTAVNTKTRLLQKVIAL